MLLVTVIVAAVAAVGVGFYWNAQLAVEDLSGQVLDQAAGRIEREVHHLVHVAQAQGHLHGALLAEGTVDAADHERLARHFVAALRAAPELTYLSFALHESGRYVHAHRDRSDRMLVRFVEREPNGRDARMREHELVAGGERVERAPWIVRNQPDPRQRPYYLAAQQAGAPTWTESYVFLSDTLQAATPGVSYAVPVFRRGALLGVLTADFDLATLSDFVGKVPVGEAGAAYVVEVGRSGRRRVIAHPDPAVLVEADGQALRPIEAIEDPRVRVLGSGSGAATSEGMTPIAGEVEGVSYVGGYMRLDSGPPWLIAAVLPEDEITGRAREMSRLALWVGVGGALLAVLLGIWLSSLLSRALDALAEDSRAIGQWQLEGRPAPSTNIAEIGELHGAFERMKTGLRGFQRYLPMQLVRQLIRRNEEPRLGGEARDLTIYFSDVAGFTTVSEGSDPIALSHALGEYLAALSDALRDHEGTVVQYVGDEIMAFWNAPEPVEHHALKAVRAVLACREAGARTATPFGEPFKTRFGLHRARVMVGHFGTPDRLYYSAIGDGVNLTSRLEGLNKHYGTEILLSEDVYADPEVAAQVAVRPLDRVAVKGKSDPMLVYELFGWKADADEAVSARIAGYTEAFEAYQSRRFAEAAGTLEALLVEYPGDEPAARLKARVEALIADPPGPEWDGVRRMDAK